MTPKLPLSRVFLLVFLILSFLLPAFAQVVKTNDPPQYGPFNGVFRADGDGIRKTMNEKDTILRADSAWTIMAWIEASEPASGLSFVAGFGDPAEQYSRYIAVDRDKIILQAGRDDQLSASKPLTPGEWHLVAGSFDGTDYRLFVDGVEAATGRLALGGVSPVLQLAPAMIPAPPTQKVHTTWKHFGGRVYGFTILRAAVTADEMKQMASRKPDASMVLFEEGSKPWPVQTNGQAGYRAPQDAGTMPRGKAAVSKPVVHRVATKPLEEIGNGEWSIGGWSLIEAPKIHAAGPEISQERYSTKDWMTATVPGTVLTSMIDNGIYPDPDYGLNNLAIPETLNKQDYWYRTEFTPPASIGNRRLTLTFLGINYLAHVWVNGNEVGTIKGAFRRGVFDVTGLVRPGKKNVMAVRVSPPPHPGIPQEQSMLGGPGENGGIMCLDGPTFVATEGWDWIPAIRDRNTGLWQPVTLRATDALKIGDPKVVTKLPLPDTSSADVSIEVPVINASQQPVQATVTAQFDQVKVEKNVTLAPGETPVRFTVADFPQLHVANPRLWWPNGYGRQELYELKSSVLQGGKASDAKSTRFGIREITYELSLFDSTGHLRRVEYSPTAASAKGERVVDITHNGMRELPPNDPYPPEMPVSWRSWWKSWAASLYPEGEKSASLKDVSDVRAAPYLILKVNGVRIACRGGNWGMDDSRKRVSREKLEPYFRLQHDANLNFIRNWVGQDTEETFYDLADEYGFLIWNDFWATTQNYNIEPQDPELFLDNARDTILHFRNHPSIAVWCGRNEGVPQPILNEGLDRLITTLDGTRYYSPSSNEVNLQKSGPYKFQDPTLYYTALNHGFSVETGTPSMSTLESFRAWVPKEDQWPISDTWAYHDWHQSGNGDTGSFMWEIQAEFGAPTSLEDFERKAQMLNYVSHRAIFEGMNQHLWAPNSARVLWMTQPAWPSTMWQILSSDYDTQASYYGVKKACEKVHVQLDLSNYMIAVVNNSTAELAGATVRAAAYSTANKLLLQRELTKTAAGNAVTEMFPLEIGSLLGNDVALVRLELRDASGKMISDNLYWLGAESSSMRGLTRLPPATLSATATMTGGGESREIRVHLTNTGSTAALANKLTLTDASGERMLPAYYSDNYVSLLPGEARDITVQYPASLKGQPQIGLRGWTTAPTVIPVSAAK